MEGMTRVSVESTHAKGLLPGYITVVVVSACAKSSGITEGAHLAIPLPFAKLPSHYRKILVIMSCASLSLHLSAVISSVFLLSHTKVSATFNNRSANIYCGLFEMM